MSFFSKIVENKGAIIAGTAVAALVGLGFLYKSYASDDNEGGNPESQEDQLNLDKEIQGLKKEVNLVDPSLDDVKRILQFSMDFAKKKVLLYSKQFKLKRRQFNGNQRLEKMSAYLTTIQNGLEEVQNISVNLQQEIMRSIGLNQMIFSKYQQELQMFMQQLMMSGQTQGVKEMSIEEVKFAIRLQIDYINNHGQQLANSIVEATVNWPIQKKQQVPMMLSVIIADGAFESFPQIDEEAIQQAEMKLQQHLMQEMSELQRAMAPMMGKLSQMMGGGMGMGGMGGMGMDGGMDPMMQGLSPEQLQQLQRLQQLQMQDPAAFQEMMRSMYG